MHDKDRKLANKAQYIANRKKIIALSQNARLLMEMGQAESVNDGLLMIYETENPKIKEMNTFGQWKDKGFTILKGEKAFLVWGQPRKVSQIPEGATEPEEFKYWPLCYLFADTQVIKPEKPEPVAIPPAKPETGAGVEMDAILI